jgi:TolB-like protein/Tfp pilus assembly protein PilF
MVSECAVSPEVVRAELERVLASKPFNKSPRLSRFLRFTVEQTIQGHQDLKEYLLGTDVFDRGPSFDPQADPIVRVQAGRLRAKLQEYYDTEGISDELIFEFPRGGYTPVFRTIKSPKLKKLAGLGEVCRGRGIQSAVFAALFLGAVYYAASLWQSRNRTVSERALPERAERLPRKLLASKISSVAVLPFEDLSPHHDQAYFCDGMTETLIDALTKVDGLHVAARTSAFSFRDKRVDVETIGEKLHVGAVLEGSVRREAKRLRVSAQLVNASDGLNTWSETYDRDFADVFAIQDEIARAIVSALETQFAPSSLSRVLLTHTYPRDPEAYALYLRGHYHLQGLSRSEIEKAMSYFAKAMEIDPGYALAYAGMAEAYNSLGGSNFSPPNEVMPKARAAALRALEIDESLPEAHAALGLVKSTYEWDWKGAEQEFKRAIELNPGYVSAYEWYGLTCLASTGRTNEALAAITQARNLDPLSLNGGTNLATILLRLRRYDEAIKVYMDTVDLEPQYFWAYRDLGLAEYEKHEFNQAVQTLEKANALSRGNPGVKAALGYYYAAVGKASEARTILNELKDLSSMTYVPPYHIAAIYAGLGNTAQALAWLNRAYLDRSTWMNGIKEDPLFASLHGNPQFDDILTKMGLN